MFRLKVSAHIEKISATESSFLSICVRYFPPRGKMKQMLRQIDPANEMAVPETEVIHIRPNSRFAYTTRQEMMAE